MTGTYALDGRTYAQCPDKLHFHVLTDQPTSTSEMILVPCTEDLRTQKPTALSVQFIVYDEFETPASSATNFKCFAQLSLGDISSTLTKGIGGTDTAHIVVRGVAGPLLGLVVDAVPFKGRTGTAGNEPSFEGGRSATVLFPDTQ